MISLSKGLPGIVIEGSCEYPIQRIIGNGVSNPLDVVRQLAVSSGAIVFRVDDLLD